MPDHEQELEKRLLSAAWGTDLPSSVEKLPGDASTRVYFRALYPDKGSAIIMLQPHPGRDEEAAFLEIQEFLEALGLPVPRVYAHDRNQGLVILEDLGDNLLESVVERYPCRAQGDRTESREAPSEDAPCHKQPYLGLQGLRPGI